jgi:hypothetical protein
LIAKTTITITVTFLLSLSYGKVFSQSDGHAPHIDTTVTKSNHLISGADSIAKGKFNNYKSAVKDVFTLRTPGIKSDTTPVRLLAPYFQMKNNVLSNLQAQQRKLTDMTKINNLLPLSAMYKNPITLHHTAAEYNRTDNEGSYVTPSGRTWYGDFEVSSSWSIATIPFDVRFNNQTWNDVSNNNFSNLAVQFNKEDYLRQLKKNLKDKFNPEEFLSNDIRNQIDGIKQNAEQSLKKDLEKINEGFGDQLKDKIGELGDLKTMMSKDIHSVREQLLNNQYIQSVAEKEKLLAELQNKKNTGQPVDEKELQQIQQEVAKVKGVNALVQKVEEHKSKWESSGVVKKIKQLDLLDKKQLDKIAKDPATTIKQAKQHLQLNGLQKLFLKLNQLNIGQNTLSESRLSVQHLMNKGVNTEIFDKNRFMMLGMGKLKTFNSILDQPFSNSVLSNDGNVKMISMGIGSSSAANSRVSIMTYNQSLGALNNFASLSGLSATNTFRSTVVTTISNETPIGERGSITAEVSRSATTYNQTVESDSTLPGKTATQRMLNSDNLLNSMAFALKYEDELVDQDLSYGVHANMTAPGYTNPGNTFLTSGGKEFGLNVKKSFWKRKFQASVKSDMREFNFSDEDDKKWRNFYTVMDLRMKLRKGQSVGIRYMPNKMLRIENGQKSTVTSLERLSADGTIAQRIAGIYYRNNVTLAWQKNKYVLGTDPVLNTSLTMSSFQNITLSGKLLYLNTQYDHANNTSQYVYFNSSFLSEAGITYLLLKKISLSSSLSYNSVKGWYNQVGIKQTVSGQLNERFIFNIYVDARKNLKLYQPLLYGLFRTDISINYLIKK